MSFTGKFYCDLCGVEQSERALLGFSGAVGECWEDTSLEEGELHLCVSCTEYIGRRSAKRIEAANETMARVVSEEGVREVPAETIFPWMRTRNQQHG